VCALLAAPIVIAAPAGARVTCLTPDGGFGPCATTPSTTTSAPSRVSAAHDLRTSARTSAPAGFDAAGLGVIVVATAIVAFAMVLTVRDG
jgi:hypothetical protein